MLRLTIEVTSTQQWFSDIGLRKDGNEMLSKYIKQGGILQPRFLEDFIEKYGKENIRIANYGKFSHRQQEIDEYIEELKF